MLPGPAPDPISEWTTVARVNGIVREVESVSFDTEMENDMPESVAAASRGGVGGTSGTITWALERPSNDRAVSAWNKVGGWPPTAGDVVELWVSDGTNTYKRGTWVVDKTTGDHRSGYKSSLIDKRDQITGSFNHEALLRHMTPFLQADESYRSIGLSYWYPLTGALRACGFFNVPEIEALSAISVPMQGSMWPESGTVTRVEGNPGGPIHASFLRTDYGYAAASFSARYIPRTNEPTSTPMQFTLVIPPTHHGVMTFDIIYGISNAIRVRVNTGRTVTAYFSPTSGAPWTTVLTHSMGDAQIMTLLIKNGAWTLRTETGGQATGSQSLGSGTLTSLMAEADDDSRVAGLQISNPNSSIREFASLEFVPSMRFNPGSWATMDMMPAQKGRSISALVDEILKSTLTASWWDEEGTLILTPSSFLRTTAPSAEVDDDYDITKMGWEDALGDVRSGVEVTWQSPEISKSRWRRQELWRGPKNSVTNGDEIKQFVEPDEGKEEWFGVDRTIRKLDDSSWGSYNDRLGSYGGLWYSTSGGEEVPTTTSSVSVTSDPMYVDSLVIYTRALGMPANIEGNTGTSPSATALREQFRGEALPVIRGFGRGQWVERIYRASASVNAHAPVLMHDLNYWGQAYSEDFEGGESVAQRIGDFLVGILAAPAPAATGVELMYDPRRQVGDVYTLSSEVYGVELRVLVAGISENLSRTGAGQKLTLRTLRTTPTRDVTYEDLQAAWSPSDYSGLQAAWAALNYNALDNDPLEGAPL